MKALTLTQPWATLVALGQKKIETRSWSTRYRGPLAIHAAKGLGPIGGNRGLNGLIAEEPFWSVLSAAGCTFGRRAPRGLPMGAIVAVCRLFDCVPTDETPPGWNRWQYPATDDAIQWHMTAQERAFGDYSPGRYAWLLSDIRALPEPIPARGALNLWEWDGKL